LPLEWLTLWHNVRGGGSDGGGGSSGGCDGDAVEVEVVELVVVTAIVLVYWFYCALQVVPPS